MSKPLPKDLTSYDFVKTFAVVFMIVDHIGFYFFPQYTWFRVFGRMCVPAWFFLIGYANSRDAGPRLWVGAALLVAGDIFAGLFVLPVNILITMIVIRLTLNPLMDRALCGKMRFWALAALMFVLAVPSGAVFEYGTLGFIGAIYGYLVRRREELKERFGPLAQNFLLFFLVCFVGFQSYSFGFARIQMDVLFVGILAVLTVLYFFRSEVYPELTAKLPAPLVGLLKLTGRRTLEIYVGHVLLFTAIVMVVRPECFTLLDWHFMYHGGGLCKD